MNRRDFLTTAAGMGLSGSIITHDSFAVPQKSDYRFSKLNAGENKSPIGYLIKKKSSEIQGSPWGLQFLTAEDDVLELLFNRMGESGVKWTRLGASWGSVETTKGNYNWERLDRIVDGLTSQGINIFLSVSGSNRLYHSYPAGYIYPPTRVPEALDAFCTYTGELVERYGEHIKHYEIYNEPNVLYFWRPEPDAEEYGMLVQRAGEVIHGARRDVKVIAGVLAIVDERQISSAAKIISQPAPFAVKFMSQPEVRKEVDILSYHPYDPHPESSSERVAVMREALDELKPNLPMLQGECGCPSSGDTIHFRGDAPWGYNVQSKWLLRRLLTDRIDGAIICTYFLNVEFYGTFVPGDPKTTRKGYNTKGLIQYTTWEVKPAYYTLQNLTAAIDGTCMPVNEKVEINVIDPGIFYGIGPHEDRFPSVPWQAAMRKNGKPMLAYWLPWRPQEIIKPATVRISWQGVSWNEPVCLDLITGEVREAVMKGNELEAPFADYPMVVTELSSLTLANTPQQPDYEEILSKLRWTY